MIQQCTLQNAVRAEGVGLHSGNFIKMKLVPAEEETGIIFRRIDVTPNIDIKAHACNVCRTDLSTTLESGGQQVATVEHLLSALSGLRIDNLIVEVDGPEIPIMDGSASHFVFLIQSAGIQKQKATKKFIRILKEVTVHKGDKQATFSPFDGFKINFSIDFESSILQQNKLSATVDFSSMSFVSDVSRARTFGFLKEITYLRSCGLIKGGTLKNAIVVDDDHILNAEGLRSGDEFVKHKILDAVGDIYLLGHSLIGEFSAIKSGHTLNHMLLIKLLENRDSWELVHHNKTDHMKTTC